MSAVHRIQHEIPNLFNLKMKSMIRCHIQKNSLLDRYLVWFFMIFMIFWNNIDTLKLSTVSFWSPFCSWSWHPFENPHMIWKKKKVSTKTLSQDNEILNFISHINSKLYKPSAIKLKWIFYLFVSGQIGPFWAILKVLKNYPTFEIVFSCFHGQKKKKNWVVWYYFYSLSQYQK